MTGGGAGRDRGGRGAAPAGPGAAQGARACRAMNFYSFVMNYYSENFVMKFYSEYFSSRTCTSTLALERLKVPAPAGAMKFHSPSSIFHHAPGPGAAQGARAAAAGRDTQHEHRLALERLKVPVPAGAVCRWCWRAWCWVCQRCCCRCRCCCCCPSAAAVPAVLVVVDDDAGVPRPRRATRKS